MGQKGVTRTEGEGTGEDRDQSEIWRICSIQGTLAARVWVKVVRGLARIWLRGAGEAAPRSGEGTDLTHMALSKQSHVRTMGWLFGVV